MRRMEKSEKNDSLWHTNHGHGASVCACLRACMRACMREHVHEDLCPCVCAGMRGRMCASRRLVCVRARMRG